MPADAELATDLDLAQRPGDEGAQRAHGDQLPQTTLAQRRDSPRPYFSGGGEIVICQIVSACPIDGAPDDQERAEQREEDRGDAEEADVEGTDPEIEQVAAHERAAANPVALLEAQHAHRNAGPRQAIVGAVVSGRLTDEVAPAMWAPPLSVPPVAGPAAGATWPASRAALPSGVIVVGAGAIVAGRRRARCARRAPRDTPPPLPRRHGCALL